MEDVWGDQSTLEVAGSLHEGLDLTIDTVSVVLDGAHSFNSLKIIGGSVVTHTAGQAAGLQITATLVEVDVDSRIDVSARGNTSGIYYSGASYGGLGGERSGYLTNGVYGDPLMPTDLGTGTYDRYRGGGALKLTASQLQLDGKIKSDGEYGSETSAGGA